MSESLTIKCPCCETILLVDAKSGKILEVRKPIVEESTGDRFEDARAKVLQSTERAEAKFLDAKKREQEKMDKLNALFEKKKDELKGQPIERPDRPGDFD